MRINSILHHSPEYKLSFESDHFKRSKWLVVNEQGEKIAVADIPLKLFKRSSMIIYDGNKENVLCKITDPKDSPFSVKDTFNLEFADGEVGRVIFDSKIGYERYYSNLGIELRVSGNHKTFHKDGAVIAKCKDHSLNDKTTIVYWDKLYMAQIIAVFFVHVLKDFKDYHNE